MQYIEAPNEDSPKYANQLFLAGGITNVEDWQSWVAKEITGLDITVFNPRRANFDLSKKEETVTQIRWEYNRLRKATDVLFWFSHETVQPITLFELGAALERRSPGNLFIGASPDYPRVLDVKTQTNLRNTQIKVSDSLEDLVLRVKERFLAPNRHFLKFSLY